MSQIKILLVVFVFITTYMLNVFFNTEVDLVVKDTNIELAISQYEQGTLNLGEYTFGIGKSNELIFISKGNEKYQVLLKADWLESFDFIYSDNTIESKNNNGRIRLYVKENKLHLSATRPIDFILVNSNTGQSSPYFASNQELNYKFNSNNNKFNATTFLLKKGKDSNLFVLANIERKAVYNLNERYHLLTLPKVQNLALSFNDNYLFNTFEQSKNNGDFFVFRALEYVLSQMVTMFNSKIIALTLFLLSLSLFLYPLESFTQKQNKLLESVKPLVDEIKHSHKDLKLRTLEIQKTYKDNGIKGVMSPFVMIAKIVIMIFSILMILDASSLQNMSFLFIDDFLAIGEGWKLSWILVFPYVAESFVLGRGVLDEKSRLQLSILFIYILLSFVLLTPLIVFIFIFFSLLRLVALMKEHLNFNKKGKELCCQS